MWIWLAQHFIAAVFWGGAAYLLFAMTHKDA